MGYRAYPEYSHSGVEWLGKVPADWEVRRLKFVASHNDETLAEKTDSQYEIEYVDISSVDLVQGIISTESMPYEKAPSRARRVVRHGDTLVSTVRTYLKAIATVSNPPDNLIASTGFAVIRAGDEIDAGFLSYFLQSQGFVNAVVADSTGVSYPAINASDLVCLPTAYPTNKKEQANIAQFLDHKIAQIDRLIERKKELIDKLQEQRASIITHATTRGLDNHTSMKAIGLDWLEVIPEHWRIVRFAFFIGFQEGPGIMAIDFMETGTPLLRIRNIQGKAVSLDGCNYLDPEKVKSKWYHFKCQKGDLLISGSASTGLICEVNNDAIGAICYTGILRLWPACDQIIKNFIRWLVISGPFATQIKRLQTGSAIQHYGPEHLNQMLIPLPPIDEQILIAEYLEAKTGQIDRMIHKNNEAIEQLQEYRTALITAAVTGQIDVRDWQAPEPTKEPAEEPADKEVA